MPKKSILQGFNNLYVGLQPYDIEPNVSDDIQQTLSRMQGFDYSGGLWRPLKVDTDGRLSVSTSPTQGATGVNSAVSVGTSSTLVIAANASRRQLLLSNQGLQTIYITFGATAVLATGFPLPSLGGIFLDTYTGVVSAIAGTAGQDLRVVEF